MKLLLLFLLLGSAAFSSEIKIAVAANVSYAIKTLVSEFNKTQPSIKVRVTLGSSGKLTAQINHGAPYELFMSANMNYPERLYESGLATTEPRVYAKGSLAYLSVKKRDFKEGLALLSKQEIQKIAIANPKTAPYGIATAEALKNAGIYEKLKPKFVYGESISQTVSFTVTAADVGFIAKSALFAPSMKQYKKDLNWIDVDMSLYKPISQGIVILKNGEKRSEVSAFYEFMFSDRAKQILKDYGYEVDE